MITRDRNVINITEEGDWLDETIPVQSIRFFDVPNIFVPAIAVIRERFDGSGELHFQLEARSGHPDFIGLPIAPVWLHGGFKVTRLGGGKLTIYTAYSSREDDPLI